MSGVDANTWLAGLDRVLVGVAVADEDARLVGGVLPLDDMEAGAIDLAGRVVEFVERLRRAVDDLRGPRTIDEWVSAITATADLLTALDLRDAWQRAQLTQLLAASAEHAGGATARLSLKEIRSLVGAQLRGRASRASFRTGHLTISSLVPMRGVPHRVVCLLGLDDGVFPTKSDRDGDDIILGDPRIGDRDARSDDLQQFLDAVMAAKDHLVITYAGRNERTNVQLPPSVPVGELTDVLGRMVCTGLVGRVVIVHPLQPFDPKNFALGALASGITWSFDSNALHGARALVGPDHATPPFLRHPLAAPEREAIDLAALVRFVEHPVREFLRARLDVRLRALGDEVADGLPLDLDGLQKWNIGERMLAARLAGMDVARWEASERARGTLPPGALGGIVLNDIVPNVEMLVAACQHHGGTRDPRMVEVDVVLGGGRRIVGGVPAVYGDLVRSVGYSRLGPKARLRSWVHLLALAANDPTTQFRAVTIAPERRDKTTVVAAARIVGVTSAAAAQFLGPLITLYEEGMRSPPMIFTKTSATYAQAIRQQAAWASKVKADWEGLFGVGIPGENADPAHKLVLGGQLELDDLWESHGERIARNARVLWDDLLSVEAITSADRGPRT
jgi:exodeoxyribonuclease V gamma subunit